MADEVAVPAMGFTFGAPVIVADGHEPVAEAVVVGEPFVPVEGSAPAFAVEAVEVIATPAVTAEIIRARISHAGHIAGIFAFLHGL